MTDTVYASESQFEKAAAVTLHDSLREFTKAETVEYIWDQTAAATEEEGGGDGDVVVGASDKGYNSRHHEGIIKAERNEVSNKEDDVTHTTAAVDNLDTNTKISTDCNTSDKTNNHNSIVKEAATAATTRVSSLPSAAFPQKDSSSKILNSKTRQGFSGAVPSATKSQSKKTSYVSKLPEHLFIHLKRFEFSYSVMRQVRAE
jgi:hypothetical protein